MKRENGQGEILDFLIFGCLGVRFVNCKRGLLKRKILSKYRPYLSKAPIDEGSIHITVEYGIPIEAGGKSFLFNNMQVGENFLVSRHKRKLGIWDARLEFLEDGKYRVKCNSNLLGIWPLIDLHLGSLVFFKLSQMGFAPVHAAAIWKAESLVLVAGRRGVGKSTVAAKLKKLGWSSLAEDRVFLKEGRVYGLQAPVNLKWDRADPHRPGLGFRKRLQLALAGILSRASLGIYNLMPALPPPAAMAREAATLARGKLAYLQSGPSFALQDTPSRKRIAAKIWHGNKFDLAFFNVELNGYLFAFPDSPLRNYWDTQKTLLEKELERLSPVEIEVPSAPTEAQWDGILKALLA